MLFSTNNGTTRPVYHTPVPQLVGAQRATLVDAAQPRTTLVGATQRPQLVGTPTTSRSPIDAHGRLVGSYDPLARAQATLVGAGAFRDADVVGRGVDPVALPPGAYQQAVRGGMYTSMRPSWWQPWTVYATGNIEPMGVRTHNPVTMARHTVDPFIASVRPLAPGIANWPGAWPAYRSYQPISAFCPGSRYCGSYNPADYSPTSTFSPTVAIERVGTVRATPAGW